MATNDSLSTTADGSPTETPVRDAHGYTCLFCGAESDTAEEHAAISRHRIQASWRTGYDD